MLHLARLRISVFTPIEYESHGGVHTATINFEKGVGSYGRVNIVTLYHCIAHAQKLCILDHESVDIASINTAGVHKSVIVKGSKYHLI